MKLSFVAIFFAAILQFTTQQFDTCVSNELFLRLKDGSEKSDGGLIYETYHSSIKGKDQVYVKIIPKKNSEKNKDELLVCFPTSGSAGNSKPYLKYEPISITFLDGYKMNVTFFIEINISERRLPAKECIEYAGKFNMDMITPEGGGRIIGDMTLSRLTDFANCKNNYGTFQWKLNWGDIQLEPTKGSDGFYPCPNGHQFVLYASKADGSDKKLKISLAIRPGAFDDFIKLLVSYKVKVTLIDQASTSSKVDDVVSSSLEFTPDDIDKMRNVATFALKSSSRPKAKYVDADGTILVKVDLEPKNGCESL